MLPAIVSGIGSQLAASAKRNAPGLIVRAGRLAYLSSAGVLALLSYTAWKNQNNDAGFFETIRSGKWTPEDADRPIDRSSSSSSPTGSTKTGAGINGESEREEFSERRYNARLQTITGVARSFGLHVTSGKRSDDENANANGVSGSLHLVSSGALAFDLSDGPGPVSPNERRCYEWASSRPDVFQEVILHDAGSGMHVHVAFRAGVTTIESFTSGQTGGMTIR